MVLMQLTFHMAPKSKLEQGCERKDRNGDLDEYRLRRERNNMAVKKSREKTRSKVLETAVRVEKLKKENDELEGKINILAKELSLLKELLLSSAVATRNSNSGNQGIKSNSRRKASLSQLVPDNETFENEF